MKSIHQYHPQDKEKARKRKIEANPEYAAKRKLQLKASRQRWLDKNPNWRKQHYAKNAEKLRAYSRKHRASNIARYRDYDNKRNAAIRERTLDAYGRRCQCCSETNEAFLTIDHFTQDMGMKASHNGRTFYYVRGYPEYKRLERLGFPQTVRILCMNCNWARRGNKVCPHQNTKSAQKKLNG